MVSAVIAIFAGVFAVNLGGFTSVSWFGSSRAAVMLMFLFFLVGGPLLGGYATGVLTARGSVKAALIGFAVWGGAFVWLDAVASTDPGEWRGVLTALSVVSLPLVALGSWLGARRRSRAAHTA